MSVCCLCKAYKLNRWEMFDLTPSSQESRWGVHCFTCPNCGADLRITQKARFLYVLAMLLSVFGVPGVVYIGLMQILTSLSAQISDSVVTLIIFAAFFAGLPLLWFVIWPQIIELEEWKSSVLWSWSKNKQWILSLIVLLCIVLLAGAIGLFTYFWR